MCIAGQSIKITRDHVGTFHHLDDYAYLKWVESLLIAELDSLGITQAVRSQLNIELVSKEHHMMFASVVNVGDVLRSRQVLHEKTRFSVRSTITFFRDGSGETVATIDSLWIWLDQTSGRPRRLPIDFFDAGQ